MLKIKADGSAVAGSIYCSGNYCMTSDSVSGEWYTANCMALNIVRANGTSKKFIYYLIDLDNMSMMPEFGMPGRFERKKVADTSNAAKLKLPTISSPKSLDQLVPSTVKNIDMKNPPTTGRDSRLIEGPDYAWIQDNVATGAGGTHRYRKDFDNESAMRFVVWDKGAYTALAQGPWFTVDDIFLRVNDNTNNQTYDYLYTVSSDGKTLYHISFQAYEPGDFRMFQKRSANADSAAKYGWTEPSKLASTYNQGVSTYFPPDESNYTPPSNDREGVNVDKPGTTPILSQSGVNLKVEKSARVEIYGIKGNLIRRLNYTSGTHTISMANLPKGIYIVKVRFGSDIKILRVPVM